MRVAPLIAYFALTGCAVERLPDRVGVERTARVTLMLCVFAGCRIETPTPSPSVCKDESGLNPHASRLGFGPWAEGIGPGVAR